MREKTSVHNDTALHDLSAADLMAGFRARQFSPSEVLEDVLAHIGLWEPHINALYAFDPEGARAAAKASTERWRKGEPSGSLMAGQSRRSMARAGRFRRGGSSLG